MVLRQHAPVRLWEHVVAWRYTAFAREERLDGGQLRESAHMRTR
jgi:hypothetical protein